MKLTNFINLLATATVVSAAAGVAIGCQQEPVGPERLEGDIEIALQMEDLATKVDIADKTGAGTWTTGDEIAVHVTETGVGTGYRDYTINAAGSYHFTMNANITLDGYVISPSIMCDYADPAPLGSTPRVIYRTEYDMTGRDLTSPTFSYVPMMAVNDDELLYFYHVGGLVRLAMQGVPEGTNKVVVTFDGMKNVTGTCTVSNPGTNRAAATIPSGSGSGNVVTFTDVNRTAANLYLNVPIPTGNYSALTSITVEAFQDATSKSIVRINQRGRWSTVRHGHGRVIPVSFTSNPISGVRLSSTAAVTLWKSQKVQRTAVPYDAYDLEYPDATVEWTSDAPSIASVHPTTGIVTAESAGGPVTITATATPTIGGASQTATYDVYVNAVTGISVANSHKVTMGGTSLITATLTNSNNGVVMGIPTDMAVKWDIDDDDYVTLAAGVTSTTTLPVRVNATTMTASVVVNGVDEGSATLTASLPSYGAISDSGNTVTCEMPTSITFPGSGEKYKFRTYYLHPGVLLYDGYGYSITSGDDPLELLQHYYYDSQITKYGGASGTAWVNCCYFTWTGLYNGLGNDGTNITGTVSATHPGTSTSYPWRIPSGYSSLSTSYEWGKIISGGPSYSIQINKRSATTNNGSNYVHVNINLKGSPYEGKGLGYSGIGNKAGNQDYQPGILLIPDGAKVLCSGIKTTGYGDWRSTTADSSYNVITYEDLCTLVKGGCVFLPAVGYFYNASWTDGGSTGYYWSSRKYTDSKDYNFIFGPNSVNATNNDKSLYFPVKLIR